jgi:hypothetical protein
VWLFEREWLFERPLCLLPPFIAGMPGGDIGGIPGIPEGGGMLDEDGMLEGEGMVEVVELLIIFNNYIFN